MATNPFGNLDVEQIEQLLSEVRSAEAEDYTALNKLLEICYEHFQVVARKRLNSPRFKDLRKKAVETAQVINDTIDKRIYERHEEDLKKELKKNIYSDALSFLVAVSKRMEYVLMDVARRRDTGGRPPKQNTNAPNTAGEQPVDREPDREWKIVHEIDNMDRKVVSYEPEGSMSWEEKEEIERKIEATLDEMPERFQDVLRLRFWKCLSRKQIAERLGVHERTVQRILKHAKEHFKRLYTL